MIDGVYESARMVGTGAAEITALASFLPADGRIHFLVPRISIIALPATRELVKMLR